MGQRDKALDLYQRAVQHNGDDVEALVGYGSILLDLGKPDVAEPFLRRAIEIEPNHTRSRRGMIRVMMTQKRIGDAIEQMHELLRIDPSDGTTLMRLAWLLATSRDDAVTERNRGA